MARFTIITIVAGAFAASANAYAVAFYTGENCQSDVSFNNANYKSAEDGCHTVGDPGLGCVWYTNNGANSAECTAPMNPAPKSFYMAQNTQCLVGHDPTCQANIWFSGQFALQCHRVPEGAGPATLNCADVSV